MNTTKQCKGLFLSAVFICGLAISTPTLAEKPTWFGKKDAGTWMAGIKGGNMINEGTDYSNSILAFLVTRIPSPAPRDTLESSMVSLLVAPLSRSLVTSAMTPPSLPLK